MCAYSAEVILIDRELTLDEIECIEGYLIDKYFPNGFPTPMPTPQPTLITLAPTFNTLAPTIPTEGPTTLQPTIAETTAYPTLTDIICETDVKFNINYVIEESASIAYSDYKEQLRFLQLLTYSDVNPISKVSALSFYTQNDVIWNFYDDQENNRFPIVAALEQEKNDFNGPSESGTYTYSALMEGIGMFSQNGTIKDPDANLMFLITDGQPSLREKDEYPCDSATGSSTNSGWELISKLYDNNIRLYILGIGSIWNAHHKKVECLTNDAYIYTQPNFTPEEFEKIEEEFRQILCYGQGLLSSS